MPPGPPRQATTDGPLRTLVWRYLRQAGDSGVFVTRVARHGEIEAHDHVFHELVYVEAGTADHETVEGVRKLRPGDVIVIQPQVWHAYLRPRRLDILNCLIDSRLMQKVAPFLSHVDGAFEMFRKRTRDPRHTPPTVLHASPSAATLVRERLETIMAEQREKSNGWQDAASAALLQILIAVARLHHNDSPGERQETALADRTHQAVLDVASHLETHFSDSISLGLLARSVHLSPGHLSRSFARRMGMGIVEYLHRMRAEEACRLLRCTDESVRQIAARVGYNEIAYFCRCFRAQIRQSPMEFRQTWHSRPTRVDRAAPAIANQGPFTNTSVADVPLGR